MVWGTQPSSSSSEEGEKVFLSTLALGIGRQPALWVERYAAARRVDKLRAPSLLLLLFLLAISGLPLSATVAAAHGAFSS